MNTPQPEAVMRYEVTVQEDGDDLILPIPLPMLEKLGWREGDEIKWEVDEQTGAWILSKA